MKRQSTPVKISIGVAALAFGVSLVSVAAFGQYGPYYPTDRKVDDNGSVYEPGPGAAAVKQQPVRQTHVLNYAPQQSRQYYPTDRKPDDNGSVDEPGPDRP
jgi:hypothetical protein